VVVWCGQLTCVMLIIHGGIMPPDRVHDAGCLSNLLLRELRRSHALRGPANSGLMPDPNALPEALSPGKRGIV
jgi:hypothetical protein